MRHGIEGQKLVEQKLAWTHCGSLSKCWQISVIFQDVKYSFIQYYNFSRFELSILDISVKDIHDVY